jgi:hypothetical protein
MEQMNHQKVIHERHRQGKEQEEEIKHVVSVSPCQTTQSQIKNHRFQKPPSVRLINLFRKIKDPFSVLLPGFGRGLLFSS